MRLFMVLLIIVSAVIIALIVYTLTMDKVRSIATLKLIGAPDRTIIGLIVQQALSMGIIWLLRGLALVLIFQPTFHGGSCSIPESVAVVFVITVVVCLARQHARHSTRAQGGPGGSALGGRVGRWPRQAGQPLVRVEGALQAFRRGDRTGRCPGRYQSGGLSRRRSSGCMGPSGSGKTTLLNCIACILEPSSGRITLDGEVVYDDRWLKSDLRRLRLDKIGFIFQYPNLLPFLDGSDNVAVVLDLAGLSCCRCAHSRRRVTRLSRGRPSQACDACSACPAAKPNAWRLPARSPTGRASFWPTSRPRRSIRSAPES